jgi:hypothetical protein
MLKNVLDGIVEGLFDVVEMAGKKT